MRSAVPGPPTGRHTAADPGGGAEIQAVYARFAAIQRRARVAAPIGSPLLGAYFFDGRSESALAAADFNAALVRPSPKSFDAALPASAEVVFFGAPACR